MKNLAIMTALWLFAAPLLVFPAAQKVGKVSFFIGKVQIVKKGKSRAKNARMHMAVYEGDRIQTLRAECLEITLKDGSVIRIAEESDVAIMCPSSKLVSPEVARGKIWGNIKKLSKRNYDFQVSSGTATAAIRGTVFRMDNNVKDSLTEVLVYDGKVEVGPGKVLEKKIGPAPAPAERKEVAGPQEVPGPYEVTLTEWLTIVKGQQINVKPDGKYHKFEFDREKDAKDKWVQFNQKRDKAILVDHKE